MSVVRSRIAFGCLGVLLLAGCGSEGGEPGTASLPTAAEDPVGETPLEPGLQGFCQRYMIELQAEEKDVDELTRLVPPELSRALEDYTGADNNMRFEAYHEINAACAGQGSATVEMTIDGGADDGAAVTLEGGYCGTNAEGWVFTYLGDFEDDSTEKNAGQFLLEAPDAEPGVEVELMVNAAVNNVGLSNASDYLGSTKDAGSLTLNENGTGASFSFGQFELDPGPTPTVNGTLTCG